jgi:hypothetical protein
VRAACKLHNKSNGLRFDVGDFVDLPRFVVCGPFAGLLSLAVEVAGAHFAAVFSEPFPISYGHLVRHFAHAPDGAVFVVMGVLFYSSGHVRIMTL